MAAKPANFDKAHALPPDERLALGYALLDSVENADGCTQTEWEAAWAAECDRRLAAYRQNPASARPLDEVLAEIRAKLRRQ
ncbi:MAG: addiction module protein [Deltaproteobacteria bacterium]|nr:addiction module protein [Deltaproteobacteria bacterium]